ncbi:MAG: protein phosphatase CheZ [Alphaproteobacteria bacterium]|nr:protein phosphatase CheZ [Alphaproteobacteria bacterium]
MGEITKQKDGKSSYEKEQVVKIINSVISKVEHAEDISRDSIFQELRELKRIIDEARKEIGLARPGDIKDKHIPTATDELDAVVDSTAEATGTIMDCCDVVSEIAGKVGGQNGDALIGEVTKIYEACSFQDITGQRITKVVETLKEIDEKVQALVSVLGEQAPGIIEVDDSKSSDGEDEDSVFLNGPQMPERAVTQDDIDKILAEFD